LTRTTGLLAPLHLKAPAADAYALDLTGEESALSKRAATEAYADG